MQKDIFGNIIPETISIKDAADLASVSTATIRNWIKTNYLTKCNDGKITRESLDKLLSEIVGKEKLTARANKLKKDYHDNDKLKKWVEDQLSDKNINIDVLAVEYEKKLSNSYKNKEGIYYTPLNIIENMLEGVPTNEDLIFLDPACGTGNFIIKAIEKGIKPENIYGFDTDESAIKIAKERIYRKTGYRTNNVKNNNFLDYVIASNGKQKYDLIFTNPPWGKKTKKDEKLKYGKFLNAKNSLDTTSLFFFASLQVLNENGFLGFLVQEALFNIANFEDVRKETLNYNILRIIDYGKAFDGLLTKAQAIILHKNKKSGDIKCELKNKKHNLSKEIFKNNPKTIFNFWIKNEEAKVIDAFFARKHITLQNNAKWGLGIVTGNNKKYCIDVPKDGYISVYRGSDITPNGLKEPGCYIPDDFSIYQQVAPLELYQAKEKLIYRFISSKLLFYCDTEQRFILNSANLLIPSNDLGITPRQLADLFNSKAMNWLFANLFNTHKVLRGDLEVLPIHIEFFDEYSDFDEKSYLKFLKIKELGNGTYRIEK